MDYNNHAKELENRIKLLEEAVITLYKEVRERSIEQYVTPEELAEMMQFTPRTIYRRIEDGSIHTVKQFDTYRIPMSQFQVKEVARPLNYKSKQISAKELTDVKSQVFGK